MVKAFDSGAESPAQFTVELTNLFPLLLAPLLHLTCGGAVDDKDLTVSFNQGNTWLFVHPYHGHHWRNSVECTLNDLLRFKRNLNK